MKSSAKLGTLAVAATAAGLVVISAIRLGDAPVPLPLPGNPIPKISLPGPVPYTQEDSVLEEHLREITGADVKDCGHLDTRASASQMRAALACGVRAAQAGQPFVVIKSEYGIDSWIPHGLVRGSVGPILRFTYDDHPGSDKFFTGPCASPIVAKARGVLAFGCRQEWQGMTR